MQRLELPDRVLRGPSLPDGNNTGGVWPRRSGLSGVLIERRHMYQRHLQRVRGELRDGLLHRLDMHRSRSKFVRGQWPGVQQLRSNRRLVLTRGPMPVRQQHRMLARATLQLGSVRLRLEQLPQRVLLNHWPMRHGRRTKRDIVRCGQGLHRVHDAARSNVQRRHDSPCVSVARRVPGRQLSILRARPNLRQRLREWQLHGRSLSGVFDATSGQL